MPASQNRILQNTIVSRKHGLIITFIESSWQSKSSRELSELAVFRVNLRRRWDVDSVRVVLSLQKGRARKSKCARVQLRKAVNISGLDCSGQLVELFRHDFTVLVNHSYSGSRDEHAIDSGENRIVAHVPVDAMLTERAAAAARTATIRSLDKSMRDKLI